MNSVQQERSLKEDLSVNVVLWVRSLVWVRVNVRPVMLVVEAMEITPYVLIVLLVPSRKVWVSVHCVKQDRSLWDRLPYVPSVNADMLRMDLRVRVHLVAMAHSLMDQLVFLALRIDMQKLPPVNVSRVEWAYKSMPQEMDVNYVNQEHSLPLVRHVKPVLRGPLLRLLVRQHVFLVPVDLQPMPRVPDVNCVLLEASPVRMGNVNCVLMGW